jgi:hypothetical protein
MGERSWIWRSAIVELAAGSEQAWSPASFVSRLDLVTDGATTHRKEFLSTARVALDNFLGPFEPGERFR